MHKSDIEEKEKYLLGEITLDELLLQIYSSGWVDGSNDYVEEADDEEWEVI